MKTVKEVAEMTGISVRTLHYYDEIGLFKPTEVTEAGYRLYDDKALDRLGQIFVFRELDLPLADIKLIMENPSFNLLPPSSTPPHSHTSPHPRPASYPDTGRFSL